MPARPALATAAALAAVVLVAACGGSAANHGAETKQQTSEKQAETQFVDFARCLREHGVDAKAASHPGGGPALAIGSGGAAGPAAMQAAQKACGRYRAAESQRGDLSPRQKVEQEELGVKFGRCMRAHGIQVEARTSGGAVRLLVGGREPNSASPAFQRAMSACGGPKG